MAATKEAMVIILDIGKNSLQKHDETSKSFFDKEKSCCIKILQRKIFGSKKDEIALILMGSKQTDNELNRTMEEYEHICEFIPLGIPNWDMIRLIEKNMIHEGAVADWLDALIVAMDLLRRESQAKKFGNFKIVLFTTFSTFVNDDNVSFVIQGLKSMDIELVVISDNINFAENLTMGSAQSAFSQRINITQHQKHSEELVHKIIKETNGNLCNFDFAIHHLIHFQRKKSRPCFWYSTLEIGSKISIQIASTIAIKEEQHFKWVTESANENLSCWKAIEYFSNGEKIETQLEDLLKGFMFGSTPITYDESLGVSSIPTVKGLKCMAFSKKSNVLQHYLSGSGTAIVVAKKDQATSGRMFVSLVKAMCQANAVMIARRVYANGYKPKLVILIPTIDKILHLSMFELFYADQFCYWYFPTLRTKKNEPTQQQIESINRLIDSMDLMQGIEDDNCPREAFPSKNLMNLSLQYLYETIALRALNPKQPVPTLDHRLSEALHITCEIVKNSTEPLQKVKKTFKLEEIKKPGKQQLIRRLGAISSHPDLYKSTNEDITIISHRTVVEVGSVTPSEDFTILIKRGEDFNSIAPQMMNVIIDLISKSMTDQNDKIGRAIMTFREEAIFSAPWIYNDWIKKLKEIIILRKKFNFWQNVIVREHLGIISTSQSDLIVSINDEEAQEFLEIQTSKESINTKTDDEGESVDDLFDTM